MAAVLLREGQAPEAERAYREVLKDDPKNPDLYDGLGSALLMQGRVKEAVGEFDHAVKISPQKATYRINRGLAFIELGRYKEAEEDFKVADCLFQPRGQARRPRSTGGACCRSRATMPGPKQAFTTPVGTTPRPSRRAWAAGSRARPSGNSRRPPRTTCEAVRLQPRAPTPTCIWA